MKVLTTLAEGDYFLGLAALLNSVEYFGRYVDRIIVGYRGDLPSWLPNLTSEDYGFSCSVGKGFVIELVTVDGKNHMVHEKPNWFKFVNDVLAPDADEYFFFDSDIVVNKRMDFFGEWADTGVAVCGDVNYIFSSTHPIRRKWAKLAKEAGYDVTNKLDGYFNSGFLGWTKHTKQFIDDWALAFSILSPHAGSMTEFRVKDRTNTVLSANQDSFNLALMITKVPIADIGPEAMGLINGMQLMHHPLGPKPWHINFVNNFFRGLKPRAADLEFYRFVNGSLLSPLSQAHVERRKMIVWACRFASRFYRR